MLAFQRLLCKFVRERSLRYAGIVNLTRSSRPSWPLSLERGQPNRRAKDFSAPNRRATDGRRIPPPLKLTMPAQELGGGLSALFAPSSLGNWKFESISLHRRVGCKLGQVQRLSRP